MTTDIAGYLKAMLPPPGTPERKAFLGSVIEVVTDAVIETAATDPAWENTREKDAFQTRAAKDGLRWLLRAHMWDRFPRPKRRKKPK